MTEQVNQQSSFDYANQIWNIADYVRDTITPKEYNKVVLPFSLLRRLECALESTREDVVETFDAHELDWGRENSNYCQYSKKSFYNVTSFRLDDLGATDTLDALMEYVDGFSSNAREIFVKFRFKETCEKLDEADMLYTVCKKFAAFDLSPETVSDRIMSDIYEHLIQKFGESIAEGAEDFMTPKDVVRLAVTMLFSNEDETLNNDNGDVRTIYDPTAGTCGFITDALDMIEELHANKDMKVATRIVPYGQECEAESWAIGKANLLIRNVSNDERDEFDSMTDLSQHLAYGDTLSDDKYVGETFDYQLSNPPYGKKWEKQKEAVNDEAALGFRGRFGAGLPKIDDGSMLFLQHVISKLKPIEEGGGKAGIVLSASPLFNGDAGSGSSNIRRWILENDFVDCIVKLPAGIFFRTSINTYLWILSNKKPEARKGLVQLIDASEMKTSLKKNFGKKNAEISHEQMEEIVRIYVDGIENEKSVIVPYTEFFFRQVTTQQPLRMGFKFSKQRLEKLLKEKTFLTMKEENRKALCSELLTINDEEVPTREYSWLDEFVRSIRSKMLKPLPTPTKLKKLITDIFGDKDDHYEIAKDNKGNVLTDSEKKDKENIPWDMSFEEYMNKEVLPYTPEAFIDETVIDKGPLQDGKVGVVGTEISFNKYFYHYQEPRKSEEIENEIRELEDGLSDFLRGIFND